MGRNFRLERLEDNRLAWFIEAKEARWKGPPDHWELNNYEIHSYNGTKEKIVMGANQKLDTTIAITPQDFVRYDDTREMIPSTRLRTFIEEEKLRGTGNTKVYEIELYRRSADPFTILIVTVIGMAVASRKVRGGMGLHLALGIGMGAVFIFMAKFSMTFATNESLSAFAGVWLPNFVFLLIALALIKNAQK